MQLGPLFGSLLTGILDLEARSDKVERNLEVMIEETHVHVEPAPEEEGPDWVPDAERLEHRVLVQMLSVVVQLLLRVDILKNLCSVPPLSISLHHDSVRLDLLDELLGPLGEHVRLVARAD